MPSSSKKQHNFMAAVANNPAFAKKAGIPQSVGSEFIKADKGKKFAKGGDMKKLPPFMGKETKAEEAKEMKIKAKSKALYDLGEKAEGVHGKSGMKKPTAYAKGGFTKAADGVAQKGKTKAQKFADGGMPPPANQNAMQGLRQLLQGRRTGVGAESPSFGRRMMATIPPQDAMSRMRPAPTQAPVSSVRPELPAKVQEMVAARRAESSADRRPKFMQDLLSRRASARPTMTAAGPNPIGGAMKKGGCVKKVAKGGGCEVKGKTKGKYI